MQELEHSHAELDKLQRERNEAKCRDWLKGTSGRSTVLALQTDARAPAAVDEERTDRDSMVGSAVHEAIPEDINARVSMCSRRASPSLRAVNFPAFQGVSPPFGVFCRALPRGPLRDTRPRP